MNIAAMLTVALALAGPTGPDKGGEEGGRPRHPILPYPPEVPKVAPAVVEENDDDVASLVDDLEDYRTQFYRDELPIRYGAPMKRVKHVLGPPDVATYPPDGMGRVLWWYGDSFVVFRDRRVVAWEENDKKLAFGLEVAPRDYLPKSAYRQIAPPPPGSILAPGAAGGLGLSPAERARTAYLAALNAVRSAPNDPLARARALELGRAYYGMLRTDGQVTDSDIAQIQRDIDQAAAAGAPGPATPVPPGSGAGGTFVGPGGTYRP
jgi:hypothetical protein